MDWQNMTILGSIGLVGVCLYIGIYILLQLEILRGGSYPHSMLSLVAASMVLASLTENFNLSSAIIQSTWIVISVLGLARLYFVNKMTRFDTLELVFIKTKMAGLSNTQARKLLKMGSWKSGHSGDTLITQDQPVDRLYYLAGGHADVIIDGSRSAICEKGDFIGEITYLNGAPATGTVVLTSPCTLFSIEVAAMRKLAKFGSSLHYEIEKSIADDLRSKLARTSRKPSALSSIVSTTSTTGACLKNTA